MKRITVEMVRNAVDVLGVKLGRHIYCATHHGVWCGCPLFAVAAAELPPDELNDVLAWRDKAMAGDGPAGYPLSGSGLDWITKRLPDSPPQYLVGFMCAVDTHVTLEQYCVEGGERNDIWKAGFADGLLVRQEFFPTASA